MKLEVLIKALAYELGLFFLKQNPRLKFQLWFHRMMEYCRPDWAIWKTKQTMLEVDNQITTLQQEWAVQEVQTQQPIYTEQPADDSQAQQLLGGEMRLTSPWYTEDQPKY